MLVELSTVGFPFGFKVKLVSLKMSILDELVMLSWFQRYRFRETMPIEFSTVGFPLRVCIEARWS